MNEIFKTFKLLWHNFIYFIILVVGYDTFCIGSLKYNLFGSSHQLLKFAIFIIISSILTYFFLIKTLKNKKNSIILLLILLLSIAFCISPIPISQGLFPSIFGNKIHFFFYDFFPTWAYINQGLYLILHIYQNQKND